MSCLPVISKRIAINEQAQIIIAIIYSALIKQEECRKLEKTFGE